MVPPRLPSGPRPVNVGGRGWKAAVAAPFAGCFSPEEIRSYLAGSDLPGHPLKDEPRTRVVTFEKEWGAGKGRFVLKMHLYPHLSGISTLGLPAISEREFRGLAHTRILGVPAVEPVAFAARRGFEGMVRSCFLITRYVDGVTDLREWVRSRAPALLEHRAPLEVILAELGSCVRRLHRHRFFLHNPTLRNILLRGDAAAKPQLIFLDMPFARFIHAPARASRGQARDLGWVFGPLIRHVDPAALEPFFAAYLPDPLGADDHRVRRAALWAARAHNNQTAYSGARWRLHRSWMRLISGGKRKRPRCRTAREA